MELGDEDVRRHIESTNRWNKSVRRWIQNHMESQFPPLEEAIARLNDRPDDAEAAAVLFWMVLNRSEAMATPELVERLELVESCSRPSDQPAALAGGGERDAYLLVASPLLTLVHVREGFSDRFLDILDASSRCLEALPPISTDVPVPHTFVIRAFVHLAAGWVDLWRARYYAFDYRLHEALVCYETALERWGEVASAGKGWDDGGFLGEDFLTVPVTRKAAMSIASAVAWFARQVVDLKEIVSTYERLEQPSSEERNWVQISDICGRLSSHLRREIGDADVCDMPWMTYWENAAKFASVRHSPWRERQAAEAGHSRSLLTRYFLQDLWMVLPDRAQRCLITADEIYRSEADVRHDLVLNELRLALEAILRPLLFHPFDLWVRHQDWLAPGRSLTNERRRAITEVTDKLNNRRHEEPTLGAMLRIMWYQRGILEDFLGTLGLPADDVRFLCDQLYIELDWLNQRRVAAEHPWGAGTRSSTSSQLAPVTEALNRFLGIGQKGVIPQLLDIQAKLATKKKGP